MAYVAQLLPDRAGAEALRKLMLAGITRPTDFELDDEQQDSLHELYAKLTADMRRKR